jgi:serine/threonine-protein kinase
MMNLMIGKRLNDRYKILKLIGSGGMSKVYLAHDMILDRDVAVKMLRLDYSDDPDFLRRFQREAYSVTTLSHPNIVSSYDVGEESGLHYIVMEYVKGETLKEYIQRNYPIDIETVLKIMEQLTSAISHAHHFQIVHRDIKPQNILINSDGKLKVTDFGIATASTSVTITQTNTVLGSVHYIAPEQARGGIANKKTDIYSLGIVMFELLTGRVPFSGESVVSIALKHLQSEVPAPSKWNDTIPQSVENIVLKATAKDPFYRYESVDEMKLDVQTALDQDRKNEKKYVIPSNNEETKIIPIIKDVPITNDEDTVIIPVQKGKEASSDNKIQDKKNKKKPKNNKKNRFAKFIIGIFIVLTIGGLLAITVIPALFLPNDIEVPDVRNMTYENAVTLLASKDLKISDPKEIYDNEIEKGKVVKTSPAAGETVKEKSSITIYKSSGKQSGEMEDLTGYQYDSIKDRLKSDYKSVTTHYVENDASQGEIVDQSPKAGDDVVQSDEDLEVWISKGHSSFGIRDLTGLSKSDANSYAKENKLKVNFQDQESDTVDKGLVISQTPSAGSQVKEGDSITVYLSSGAPKQKAKEVLIKATIPYMPSEPDAPEYIEVYITDANHTGDKPAITMEITETTPMPIPIKLTIMPGQTANYKIFKDHQPKPFVDQNVPY